MPTAYKGNAPYIFVSYAHKDSKTVVPIIDAMQKKGYRIWFDEGIEAGTEWSNNIAAHLEQCAVFLVFASHNSVKSENCLDEIAFAKSHQKPSLLIFLQEDVVLPSGTEMQTARFQRMFYTRHGSNESFVEKLSEAPILDSCWSAPVLKAAPVKKEEPKSSDPEPAEDLWEEEPAEIKENDEESDGEEFNETTEEKKRRRRLGGTICAVGALLELSYCLAGPKAMELILTYVSNGWLQFLLMIIPHALIALIVRLLVVKNAEKLTSDQQMNVFVYNMILGIVSSILAVIIGIFHVPLEMNGFLKFLLPLGLNVVPALTAEILYFSIIDISTKKCREKRDVKVS